MSFRVAVVDNRDSFVHILAGYLADLGAEVVQRPAQGLDVTEILADADAVLVSPGPGHPVDAGASIAMVRAAGERGIPLLGVCLGHQALAVAFGARVSRAPELLHGITSRIHHDGRGVFAGLADGFTAHRTAPLTGVQFHPESVLTDAGHALLGTWLEDAGLPGAAAAGRTFRPRRGQEPVQ